MSIQNYKNVSARVQNIFTALKKRSDLNNYKSKLSTGSLTNMQIIGSDKYGAELTQYREKCDRITGEGRGSFKPFYCCINTGKKIPPNTLLLY